jgi:hypothetical protein
MDYRWADKSAVA